MRERIKAVSFLWSPVGQGVGALLWLLLTLGGHTPVAMSFASMLLLLGIVQFVRCMVAVVGALWARVAAWRVQRDHGDLAGFWEVEE